MSETPVADNPDTLKSKPYTELVGLVHDLVMQDAELFYFEETDPNPIGVMRVLSSQSEEDGFGSMISVALYDPYQDRRQAAALKLQGREVENPIGHIQIDKQLTNARVACTIYIQEDGQVKGYAECSVPHVDELFAEDSEECFDLMDAAGMGRVWVKGFLFRGQKKERVPFELDDRMMSNLTQFLGTVSHPDLANMP